MFKEIKNVRQIPGESMRRWFTDNDVELIMWIGRQEEIVGFQLCYKFDNEPKALTWHKSSGFLHSGIDEGDVTFGKHKKSPILIPDMRFNKEHVLMRFASSSKGLPEAIESFVRGKIEGYK